MLESVVFSSFYTLVLTVYICTHINTHTHSENSISQQFSQAFYESSVFTSAEARDQATLPAHCTVMYMTHTHTHTCIHIPDYSVKQSGSNFSWGQVNITYRHSLFKHLTSLHLLYLGNKQHTFLTPLSISQTHTHTHTNTHNAHTNSIWLPRQYHSVLFSSQ